MEQTRKTSLKADMMLVLVTLCWGLSYYFMDICLNSMDAFTLNAYRFLIAFFAAGIFSYKKLIKVSRATLLYSLAVGTALVFVYSGATLGVKYTTLSNAAFLCSTTVIATPILEFVLFRKKTSRKILLAVAVCMFGIMLLTLKDDFSFNMHNLKGDLFSLMAGLTYAVDIIVVDKAVRNEDVDPYQVGVFGLGVTGTIMLVLSLFIGTPMIPGTPALWGLVLFLSLFCTGLAFIVQPIAQQYTEASHVGIIYSLEPVFAGVTAFFLAGEILPARGYLGELLMISSLFIMELDFSRFTKRRSVVELGEEELPEE